jgi:hypothetical protein
VAADATRRYKNITGLEDITRHIVFLRPDYFVMLDNLAARSAHQYEWVTHFGQNVSIDGNWVRGNAGGGQILGVGVVSPRPFNTSTGDDGQPFVRIRPGSATEDVRFINVLYPTTENAWNSRPRAMLLDDTGEAAVVRVTKDSRQTEDIVITYTPPHPNIVVGPYVYDGRVAVITKLPNGNLEKLFVFGSRHLTDRDIGGDLVANIDPTAAFDAIYTGQVVYVNTKMPKNPVTLYAPGVTQLRLNGVIQGFSRFGNFITFGGTRLNYLPIILKRK